MQHLHFWQPSPCSSCWKKTTQWEKKMKQLQNTPKSILKNTSKTVEVAPIDIIPVVPCHVCNPAPPRPSLTTAVAAAQATPSAQPSQAPAFRKRRRLRRQPPPPGSRPGSPAVEETVKRPRQRFISASNCTFKVFDVF